MSQNVVWSSTLWTPMSKMCWCMSGHVVWFVVWCRLMSLNTTHYSTNSKYCRMVCRIVSYNVVTLSSHYAIAVSALSINVAVRRKMSYGYPSPCRRVSMPCRSLAKIVGHQATECRKVSKKCRTVYSRIVGLFIWFSFWPSISVI